MQSLPKTLRMISLRPVEDDQFTDRLESAAAEAMLRLLFEGQKKLVELTLNLCMIDEQLPGLPLSPGQEEAIKKVTIAALRNITYPQLSLFINLEELILFYWIDAIMSSVIGFAKLKSLTVYNF